MAFMLLLLNLSCQQGKDATNETLQTKASTTLDSSIINDSNLFYFEFKILNMRSQMSIDSIDDALEQIDGLLGHKSDLETSTCQVYADSFSQHKSVINAIEKAGYKMENIFTMAGPGLTCDIAPEDSNALKRDLEISSLATSISMFKEEFNSNIDKVRIVSLPNPACLSCVEGQRFINDLFDHEFSSENRLMGFTVWVSINGWGTLKDARRLAPEITDSRMYNFWDPNMLLGKLYKTPLDLDKGYLGAWDVYLIYKAGVKWQGDVPPAPTFWMHKLGDDESGVKTDLFLDEGIFKTQVREALMTTQVP